MIIRALDQNGDWTKGGGLSNYLTFIDAYKQDLKTRILEFVNDCFFNTGAGIDWLNLLSGKSEQSINLAVSMIIINTQNTTGIVSVNTSLNRSTRALSISYSVNTVFTSTKNPTGNISATYAFILTESGSILTSESGNYLVTT